MPETSDPEGYKSWVKEVKLGAASRFVTYSKSEASFKIDESVLKEADFGKYPVLIYLEDEQGTVGLEQLQIEVACTD